ncbi:MAG: glycine oxidase ThiO [Thiobacillus sp.]
MNSLTNNVLIIGTGVCGLSAALALLQRGVSVTLLDRGSVGGESSWAGGGILSPLLPWDYAEPVSTLALASMAAYPDWITTIEAISGFSTEYWTCGMTVRNSFEDQTSLNWCSVHGMRAVMNNGNMELPEVAQVRNPRLIEALRAAVSKLGGTIHTECELAAVTTAGGRLKDVHTAQGSFTADQYVFAMGAWMANSTLELESPFQLGGVVGNPNIRPIRGQMLLFKLQPSVLNTIVYRNGLYLIPRRDGHVLVGSTLEDVGFDKSTDMPTRARLHAEAAELLPELASMQPIQHWAGLRPGSPDNIPIIGRHPDYDNVFVNTGHYRYGVTMAPASAELLVDLMEEKIPALDPAPYRWEAALVRSWGDKL